jgi:hypothetical protein
MPRLTRKQARHLQQAVDHLTRAINYLAWPNVVVARRGDRPTTTLHYTRPDGAVLYEVNKDIGSDLTGLEMGRKALVDFLAANQ